MGCVSSTLLNENDELAQMGIGHHIVSLTSTTYGLLNLDPSPSSTTPPPRITLSPKSNTISHSKTASEETNVYADINSTSSPIVTKILKYDAPEVINSWELMEGLVENDSTNPSSFRFSTLPPTQPSKRVPLRDLENSNPNNPILNSISPFSSNLCYPHDAFEKLCPPNGGNQLVIYTTSLRGVRKTFEACNAVRAAFEGFGVSICERDISMDRGFREELRELMKGKEDSLPPRVFLKGRYVGGVQEVMKILEEGHFSELVQGLPRLNNRLCGYVCDMCGGVRFLPCFRCNGSCKMIKDVKQDGDKIDGLKKKAHNNVVVVRCSDCNENGLVVCPICT